MALIVQGEDTAFGSLQWWVYAGISCFLVLFAGIMSGLTLGLVELEILQRSGTDAKKAQAAVILPVVQKQHQLLVTLLLCNAASKEQLVKFLLEDTAVSLYTRETLKTLLGSYWQVNGNMTPRSSEDIEDGEVIGIITLEDVFEELLQEEIVDETDEYVDVHKRIRVAAAAAAAASSVARAPSVRRLTGQMAAGAQNRQGQLQPTGILKKPAEGDSQLSKQVNLVEPLLENKR